MNELRLDIRITHRYAVGVVCAAQINVSKIDAVDFNGRALTRRLIIRAAGSIADACDPTWGFYAGLKILDHLTGDRFLVDPHYFAWITGSGTTIAKLHGNVGDWYLSANGSGGYRI